MGGWRGTAKIALHLISSARRLAPVAAVYARLPGAWKLRITRQLLHSATGADPLRLANAGVSSASPSACVPSPRIGPGCVGRGVNLCGYVCGEFGLGESVRGFARAL